MRAKYRLSLNVAILYPFSFHSCTKSVFLYKFTSLQYMLHMTQIAFITLMQNKRLVYLTFIPSCKIQVSIPTFIPSCKKQVSILTFIPSCKIQVQIPYIHTFLQNTGPDTLPSYLLARYSGPGTLPAFMPACRVHG